MKKKIACIIITAMMVTNLAACNNSKSSENVNSNSNNKEAESEEIIEVTPGVVPGAKTNKENNNKETDSAKKEKTETETEKEGANTTITEIDDEANVTETQTNDNVVGTDVGTEYGEEDYVEDYVDTNVNTETNMDNGNSNGCTTYLGDWTVTFYCPCSECCNSWVGAEGVTLTPWVSCANGSLAFGSVVYVEGFGNLVVQDRGVSGNWIDIFVSHHSEIPSYGMTTASVYLVQ